MRGRVGLLDLLADGRPPPQPIATPQDEPDARELAPPDPEARARAALLAAELRSGAHDERLHELVEPLRAEVRAKLEVANPRWLTPS
jgi:uncharacterized protein DUF6285